MNPHDDRFPPPPPPASDPAAVSTPSHAPADPAEPSPRRRGPRPVPPGVEYHRVLAGHKRRIGRGLLAIALLLAGLFAFNIALARAAGSIDLQMGNVTPAFGGTDYTPLYHGTAMLSIALLIPWSMLIQRWLYGVKGVSLHSVLSRFRFDVFGRAVLLIGPLWLTVTVIMNFLMPTERIPWSPVDLVAMFAITIVLTPLQSAGEEYGLRGLAFRVAGSWNRGPRTALAVGVLVSALVFTVIHLSTDPWLNLWYFTFAVCQAVITWRTGGVETAIVVHALNNTLTFLLAVVLHANLAPSLLDRSAGAGTAALLVPSVAIAVITAVLWLRTRKAEPVLTPADPRSESRPAQV